MVQAIKFYADWCGPCKVYNKVWTKVENELNEKVEFKSINIEKDTSGLAAEYKVRSIPFTVIINEEGKATTKTGLIKEEELKALLK